MTHSRARRAAALLAAPVLAVTTLTALTGAPAQADPASTSAGSTWLVRQLSDGLIHNDQYDFDDYGLGIDIALALGEVGGNTRAVQAITDAVAENLDSYITGEDFGDTDSRYAGATAKALVLAQLLDPGATGLGGENLVERTESVVSIVPATLGRIVDVSTFGDNANTLGQAFAAQGLAAADSDLADEVTAFLLDQQCGDGFFRQDFSAVEAEDQTCDGTPGAVGSVDTTALAVLALQGQRENSDVQEARTRAGAWLESAQAADGSFGGGPGTGAANANSTGLAGWALGELGEDAAAADAAVWVRGQQTVVNGRCTDALSGEQGAVAYDAAALAAGRRDGITDETADQWRRATAQAVPALQWAPDPAGERGIEVPDGYQAGGKGLTVDATGMAPGDSACAWTAGAHTQDVVGADGEAGLGVRLPSSTGDHVVTVTDSHGRVGRATVPVLGRLEVPFSIKDTVRKGHRPKVKVEGLAAHERVRVKFHGDKVAEGTTGRGGRVTLRFTVTGHTGKAKVKVFGEFKHLRRNATKVMVTR